MNFDNKQQIQQNISNYKFNLAKFYDSKYPRNQEMYLLNKNALDIEKCKLNVILSNEKLL